MTHADLPASPVPFASLTAITVRRIVVALQYAVTIAVGWVAHDWAGWHWPAAALFAGAMLVLGYLISAGWAFLVSLRSLGIAMPDDPMWDRMFVPCEQRIGITGSIACWLRGCVSVAWMLDTLQPFYARTTFNVPVNADKRVSVLMAHGYSCNHTAWLPTQQHLAVAGYPADVIDFMSLLGNIDEYIQDIAAAVAQLTCAHDRAPVLFYHSMDGPTAWALPQQVEPSPVTHVITLDTPHWGTTMARTGRGYDVRQMARASPWLHQPAASETLVTRVRITSISSRHDSIVEPPGASWLEDTRHTPFAGVGHVSLLCDARVRDVVLTELVRTESVTATASA